MSQAITKERWYEAQIAERACHTFNRQEGYDHYRASYQKVFAYLGMQTDQQGKSIIEIGPADFPALAYCSNYKGTIVEPMVSGHLNASCNDLRISLIARPFEEVNVPIKEDEAWLFNVMQHVIDPDLFIAKCKSAAKTIRFFEPVDYPTCAYHPHTFTQQDFERWFPKSVKRYTDRLEGFFDSDCVYGTWTA